MHDRLTADATCDQWESSQEISASHAARASECTSFTQVSHVFQVSVGSLRKRSCAIPLLKETTLFLFGGEMV